MLAAVAMEIRYMTMGIPTAMCAIHTNQAMGKQQQ
jgi:hypothetical protein